MAQAITPIPLASVIISTLLSHLTGNVSSAAEKTCQRDEDEVPGETSLCQGQSPG